jgi:hypothetical protein
MPSELIAKTDIRKEEGCLYHIKTIDGFLCIVKQIAPNRLSGKYTDEFGNPMSWQEWKKEYPEKFKEKQRKDNELKTKLYHEYLKKQKGGELNGNENNNTE